MGIGGGGELAVLGEQPGSIEQAWMTGAIAPTRRRVLSSSITLVIVAFAVVIRQKNRFNTTWTALMTKHVTLNYDIKNYCETASMRSKILKATVSSFLSPRTWMLSTGLL